jgi:hypothetical protein
MKVIKKIIGAVFIVISCSTCKAQPGRWQQRIKYVMDVKLDTPTNKISGTQVITYTNNSLDTLSRIFLHTYWNAFQPNSSMDVRSRILGLTVLRKDTAGKSILDWDPRVKDRIARLSPAEIGYCRVTSIQSGGKTLTTKDHETILEVTLAQPILPGKTVTFNTVFECQVPVQIRRSGRNSAEGIQYSMSQWYPKMVEYDYQGWNANPYIAREFYGVWGDFDVNITLDKNYKIGATGVLKNAVDIGWGYDKEGTELKPVSGQTRTWKFSAQNLHDFVWAADLNYKHITRQTEGGPLLHFIYQTTDTSESKWQATADACQKAYPFIAKTFGPYPWPSYSFLHGGDGGMEYGMATLVKNSSQGTALHEWLHSWYQQLFGTNESLYPWMDEGFTTYAELRTSAWLRGRGDTAFRGAYRGYFNLARSGYEEPMSTHSDHYNTNYAYSNAAYSKGCVFLQQLGYIIGQQNLDKVLLEYYRLWKFQHPNPNDFIRVAEKISGLELDWYKEYWVYTTKMVDYGIDTVAMDGGQTVIRLYRSGLMPMPIDVQLTFKDGTKENHYIPLSLMYGTKPAEDGTTRKVYDEWRWTHPYFNISTSRNMSEIAQIQIDPTERLADVNKRNNTMEMK